jgi:hypothetical protein
VYVPDVSMAVVDLHMLGTEQFILISDWLASAG